MKCAADPACPFPAVAGGAVCGQHAADLGLPFTLHEVSCCGQVRILDLEGELWRGFAVMDNAHGVAWDRRLRVAKEEKMKRAYTYCGAYLPEKSVGGNPIRCSVKIPVGETICDACKERLLPTEKAK